MLQKGKTMISPLAVRLCQKSLQVFLVVQWFFKYRWNELFVEIFTETIEHQWDPFCCSDKRRGFVSNSTEGKTCIWTLNLPFCRLDLTGFFFYSLWLNDGNAPSELIWTSFWSPRQTSVVISSTGVSTTATNTSGNDRRPRNASLSKPLTLFRSFILYSSQMAKPFSVIEAF